ncbi:hypothetical protein DPMN_019459 [Dreissena polymorpha]|uniref:Uncharacterized protein n=1 Tax=Dreissena polymorpha TaxID=45954 RepID=A0A9D4NIJ1_DREPO|nr:hypothetical protein DPMN_133904 [Dreissena polymorpha]KAH3895298.1 hypothetical protein DPMN_019459 [Dreissena polymorpha]
MAPDGRKDRWMERRTDGKTYGRMDGQSQNNIPLPMAGDNNNEIRAYASFSKTPISERNVDTFFSNITISMNMLSVSIYISMNMLSISKYISMNMLSVSKYISMNMLSASKYKEQIKLVTRDICKTWIPPLPLPLIL